MCDMYSQFVDDLTCRLKIMWRDWQRI